MRSFAVVVQTEKQARDVVKQLIKLGLNPSDGPNSFDYDLIAERNAVRYSESFGYFWLSAITVSVQGEPIFYYEKFKENVDILALLSEGSRQYKAGITKSYEELKQNLQAVLTTLEQLGDFLEDR